MVSNKEKKNNPNHAGFDFVSLDIPELFLKFSNLKFWTNIMFLVLIIYVLIFQIVIFVFNLLISLFTWVSKKIN